MIHAKNIQKLLLSERAHKKLLNPEAEQQEHRDFFSESCKSKPIFDCNFTFPIYLTPNLSEEFDTKSLAPSISVWC